MRDGSIFSLFDDYFGLMPNIEKGNSRFFSSLTTEENGKIKRIVNDNGKITKTESTVPSRISSKICSHGDYPPTDLYTDDEDGSFHIHCALAGVSKDRLRISYEDEELCIEVVPAKESKQKKFPKRRYGAIQIKSDSGFKKYVWIQPLYFDASKISYTFEDGILDVAVQRNQSYVPARVIKELPEKAVEKLVSLEETKDKED